MINRPYWIEKIHAYWKHQSIVWLSGVWRSGKTSIANMLDKSSRLYLNCDSLSIREKLIELDDYFISSDVNNTVIFDEIHRLDNPGSLLKMAAYKYPKVKFLAIGASMLPTTDTLRDTLTRRNCSVQLPPVPWDECIRDFNISELNKRLLYGGLPDILLDHRKPLDFFPEWIDRVFAEEIQHTFKVRNREKFKTLFGLLLINSGAQIDISNLSRFAKLSRPTTYTYLTAMESSHLIHLVRPFHRSSTREIRSKPKCYAFDTGFIAYERGWDDLREEDCEILWKHLVLDMLRDQLSNHDVYYWQDKANRGIDFVLRGGRDEVHLIECVTDPDRLSLRAIKEFRRFYPTGENLVLTPKAMPAYKVKVNDFVFTYSNGVNLQNFLNLSEFRE